MIVRENISAWKRCRQLGYTPNLILDVLFRCVLNLMLWNSSIHSEKLLKNIASGFYKLTVYYCALSGYLAFSGSTPCPTSHKFALNWGHHCYASSHKINDVNVHSDCDGGFMRFEDNLLCCPGAEYSDCLCLFVVCTIHHVSWFIARTINWAYKQTNNKQTNNTQVVDTDKQLLLKFVCIVCILFLLIPPPILFCYPEIKATEVTF